MRERLPELELGEKISLARGAPPGLLSVLAADDSHRVIAALLANPRLLEADVVAIVRRERVPAEVLRVVAATERWISRPTVRIGVLSHPRTPVHSALKVLRRLTVQEVRALLARTALPPVVRFVAEKILNGEKARPR